MLPAAQPLRALTNCFSNLKYQRLSSPNSHAFSSLSSLLRHCKTPALVHQVHSRLIVQGLQQNPALASDLIARYAALGRLDLTIKLYGAVLRSLSSYGEPEEVSIYPQMPTMYPDDTVFLSILRGCTYTPAIETGVQVHCHAIKLGFERYASVGTALVVLYGRHREVGNARQVFEEMPERDLASWNAILSGAGECGGDPEECFSLFERMRMDEHIPDSLTAISLLHASVDLKSMMAGKFVHALILKNDLGSDLSVSTALLTMYCKLGYLGPARLFFDRIQNRDCAVWNVMISGLSRNGKPEQALCLFGEMAWSGIRTDFFTAIAALTSVSLLRYVPHGKQIHGHAIRNGADCQVSVHNSLVEMYCNCRSLKMARKVFDLLTNKTTVSWSCMIKGYISIDFPSEALLLFKEMKKDGTEPDAITLVNVLPACVILGALEQVKNIHSAAIRQGLVLTVSVGTALLVSYAKCGCMEMARKLFDEGEIDWRDIVLWNSMIAAYSKHGSWCQSFDLYNQMKDSGVLPDEVTFLGLLTACVNSGLVKEGWECFSQMVEIYRLQPGQEHYACMVDLLGRFGHLDQAKRFIEGMPLKPDVRVWGPLLSACKLHSETRLAEFASKKLIQMEPNNAGNYVLLSNIYAVTGRWESVAKMRSILRDRGLKKTAGYSSLEVNGRVHKFLVMDQSHPESKDIYAMLRIMQQKKDDAELIYS